MKHSSKTAALAPAMVISVVVMLGAAPAVAGCDIFVTVKNATAADIYIFPKNFKVKSKGGAWRKLSSGGWFGGVSGAYLKLTPGQSYNRRYQATFGGCNTKRRYRLGYGCVGWDSVDRVQYSPSPTGWARTTNLRINASSSC